MAERLGITGGTSFLSGAGLDEAKEIVVETSRGEVTLFVGERFAFLPRHGHGMYRPPHRIDHRAHILAFEEIGVSRVAGMNSVGSLSAAVGPGTVVVCDDYLSVHAPPTFCGDERLHVVPALDPGLRGLLLAAARATLGPVVDGGVYVETTGPRFETPAEIRWLARLGDIVGMTAASEATLCTERGIGYAMLGMVDNLANGLAEEPLTFEAFERQVKANELRAKAILRELTARFAAGEGES